MGILAPSSMPIPATSRLALKKPVLDLGQHNRIEEISKKKHSFSAQYPPVPLLEKAASNVMGVLP
jgi:hypothetical protein